MYKTEKILKVSERGSVELVSDGNGKMFIRRTVNASDISEKALDIIKENPHELIPKIFSIEHEGDKIAITEEYTEGELLKNASLSDKQLIRAAEEICTVLSHIHSLGVIHRDIKPSNILLADDGHIRLIDFETARVINADSDKDTVYLGTEGYAPPEQYGYSQTDIRSDIYALGKTLEQIMGSMVYQKKYRAVIDKCTEFDPKNRYSNADEVRRALIKRGSGLYIVCAAAVLLIFAAIAAIPRDSGDISVPDEAPAVIREETVQETETETDIAEDIPEVLYGKDAAEKYPTSFMDIDLAKAEAFDDFSESQLLKAAEGIDMKYIIIDGKALGENKYAAMALDFDGDGVTEIFQISEYLEEGADEPERRLCVGMSYRDHDDVRMVNLAKDYFFDNAYPKVYKSSEEHSLRDDYYVQISLCDFDGNGSDECIISIGLGYFYMQDGELWGRGFDTCIYSTVFFANTNKKLWISDLESESLSYKSDEAMYIDGTGVMKSISVDDGYINEYSVTKGTVYCGIPSNGSIYRDKSDNPEIDPEIVRQMEAHGLTPYTG